MPSKKKVRFAKFENDIHKMVRMSEVALINTPVGEVIDFSKMMEESAYGKLTTAMQHAMDSYVKDRRVFDFGAGDMTHAQAMLKMGAMDVVAIEKNFAGQKSPDKRIKQFEGTFLDYIQRGNDFSFEHCTAFISWPANHKLDGLLDLLEKFRVIMYLGKNTDGSACAWPGFFHQMYLRPVLEHVPHRRNTLIIWGEHNDKLAIEHRELKLEERAGGDHTRCYDFDGGSKGTDE